MEYTSELQVTHHHEHCRFVDGVLGDADRGREVEGGPQEVDWSEPRGRQLLVHRVAVCRHQRVSEVDRKVFTQLELSTNAKFHSAQRRPILTRAFSLSKVE